MKSPFSSCRQFLMTGLLAACCLVIVPTIARGQDGTLDLPFNPAPDQPVGTVVLQTVGAEQKLLVGGYFSAIGGGGQSQLARLNADGTEDITFAGTANGNVSCLSLCADGDILACGQFTTIGGGNHAGIARLAPNGTHRSTFTPSLAGEAFFIRELSNGKIIVGGVFNNVTGSNGTFSRKGIALLNADGTVDGAFNAALLGNPSVGVFTLDIQPSDGALLIGGRFTSVGGVPRGGVARISSVTGALDTSFNVNTDGQDVIGIYHRPNGNVIFSGTFTNVNSTPRNGFAEVDSNGALTSWAPDFGGDSPRMFVTQGDGKLIAAGLFASVNGALHRNIVRFHTNGTVDSAYNPGFPYATDVYALALQSDGKVVLGGEFFWPSGVDARNYLARIHGPSVPSGPEIVVEQPVGTERISGNLISFGSSSVGVDVVRTFKIKNIGTTSLTLTQVTKTGTGKDDYHIGPFGSAVLAPNVGETTFTVTFTPTSSAVINATVHIESNDANENPFDILVTGTGVPLAPEIAVEQPTGTDLTSGSAAVDFGSSIVGGGIVRTFLIKSTGPGALSGVTAGVSGSGFSIITQPAATVAATTGSTTVGVRFTGGSVGTSTGSLQIGSNDANENPFVIALAGEATSTVLNAAFNTAADVPLTVDGLITAGLTLNLSLNFAPATGTQLVVVNNTGGTPITGVFAGLAEGAEVTLNFSGQDYKFIVTYTGGTGNDLVLLWPGGGIVSWGYNREGQTGVGSTTTVSPYGLVVPTETSTGGVLAGKKIKQIDAGLAHSLAVTTDGKVFAWGENGLGQLGNGTNANNSLVPVAVDMTGVLAGKTVTAISAGGYTSLALCSDGTVYTWGFNSNGQLGNGSPVNTNSSVPVAVSTAGALSGKIVTAISAGYYHALALTSDGKIYGWGSNGSGDLGDHTNIDRHTPVAMDTSYIEAIHRTATTISAGGYNSMVLDSAGDIYVCGSNTSGQLGADTYISSFNSLGHVFLPAPFASTPAVSVVACEQNSYVLGQNGRIFSCGYPNNGALGIGIYDSSTLNFRKFNVVDASGVLAGKAVTAIDGGNQFGLALTSDGKVYSWGANGAGNIGDGTHGIGGTWLSNRHSPVAVDMGGALLGKAVTSISCGSNFALALAVTPPAPEIAVEQPEFAARQDSSSTVDFGTTFSGDTIIRTFTIRNTGLANLIGLGVAKDGPDDGRFTLGSLGTTTLIPGASTTFTVIFAPNASGACSAAIHIASNDSNENTFDIALIGTGGVPITDWRQQNFSPAQVTAGQDADDADPDKDGVSNLLEFAIAADPKNASAAPTPLTPPNADYIELSYTRNKLAMAELTYQVQWTDDLQIAWSSVGVVETIISDNGLLQQVTATLPAGPTGHRFVHLKVTRP